MSNLLWAVAGLFIVMWLLGFSFHVGGGVVHLLLVLAVVAVGARLLMGRREA